jgi:hypothetical protein
VSLDLQAQHAHEVLVKLTLYAPCSIARGTHSVKASLENVAVVHSMEFHLQVLLRFLFGLFEPSQDVKQVLCKQIKKLWSWVDTEVWCFHPHKL